MVWHQALEGGDYLLVGLEEGTSFTSRTWAF